MCGRRLCAVGPARRARNPWSIPPLLVLGVPGGAAFKIRAFNGSGNNVDFPQWGAAQIPQVQRTKCNV